MVKENQANLATLFLVYSMSLLFALATYHVFALAGMMAGISISVGHIFVLLVLFVLSNFILAKRYIANSRVEYLVTSYLIFALSVAGALMIARAFTDFGGDSQTAHLPGIIHLANGWNPIWDPWWFDVRKEVASNYLLLNSAGEVGAGEIDYPSAAGKFAYFLMAAIYAATGNIEDGKLINWLLIICLFTYAYGALRTAGVSNRLSWLASAIVSLNPVIIYQSKTVYVDAYMSVFLSIFILSVFHLSRANHSLVRIAAVLSLALIISTKLSGLYYGIFFGGVSLGLLYFFHPSKLPNKKTAVAIACLITFVTIHPYATNIKTYGNPFYPATLVNKQIFVSGLSKWFHEAGRIDGFLMSVFSKSNRNPDTPELKFPFKVTKDELLAFQGPDARIGGGGPLFGGAVILSLMMLLWYLVRYRQYRAEDAVLIVAVLVSALIPQITWWMRFTPHVWLIPILLVITVLPQTRDKITRLLGLGTASVMLLNSIIIASVDHRYQSRMNSQYLGQIAEIRQLEQPIRVSLSNFRAGKFRFPGMGVKYVSDPLCAESPDRMPIVLSENTVCLPPGSGVKKNW